MLISKLAPSNAKDYSKNCRGLKNTGATCSKGRPSVYFGGPSMATKIAVDSPGGPLVVGDELQCDSTFKLNSKYLN